MESQSCVEFCRLSWRPDSIALNISVTPKSLLLTSTKGLLPEHWQTGHTVGGLVWDQGRDEDWVWEETPSWSQQHGLAWKSFLLSFCGGVQGGSMRKALQKQDRKKKKKRNETETPTVGLACLALSEWHSNIGLMNERTPFCQVKGSIEYHLLLYYISSGCLVIKLPWLFSVIFSLILYSDLEERRWRQLISGGKAVANGDVKTV